MFRSLLFLAITGCSTITLRTGMVVVGGRPAFQASVEMGPSVMRTHRGVSATQEYGVEADGRGARPIIALNIDTVDLDPDVGPVMRAGVRFRGSLTRDGETVVGETDALLVRGAAYTGIARDPKTQSGGFGVEIAGGVTTVPSVQPIFEANLVFHGHVKID